MKRSGASPFLIGLLGVIAAFSLLVSTTSLLGPNLHASEGTPACFVISHEDYVDRVTAIWLGQMLGQRTGARFEARPRSVVPDTPASTFPGYVPVDDDFYYEMVAVRAFERYGIHMTLQDLGRQWLANDAGSWGSSREALLLMRRGIMPPNSGSPRYNKLWWTIGAQFSSDLYGALSPAMPNQAAALARKYGHINGYAEGTDGAVFIAGMISVAFAEHDPHKVVKEAAALISPQSPYRKALDCVIEMAEDGHGPSDIFATLVRRWGVEYPGTNNAVLNGAIVATGVWFGGGDFDKTLQILVHAADFADTDCNAANAESVIAAMYGTKALPRAQVRSLHDRVKGDTLGPVQLTPPVDESITNLGRKTAAIGESMMRDDGLQTADGILKIPIQKPITQPAELFQLADLMKFWNPKWSMTGAGFGGGNGGVAGIPGMTYLAGDTLATFPYDEVRGVELKRTVKLSHAPSLSLEAGVDDGRGWRLAIYINDDPKVNQIISAQTAQHRYGGRLWRTIHLNLHPYAGQTVVIRLYDFVLNVPEKIGNAYWRDLAAH